MLEYSLAVRLFDGTSRIKMATVTAEGFGQVDFDDIVHSAVIDSGECRKADAAPPGSGESDGTSELAYP